MDANRPKLSLVAGALPGDGALPLANFLDILPSDTPLSVQSRSKRLRDDHANPTEWARVLLAATNSWMAHALKTPSCGAT